MLTGSIGNHPIPENILEKQPFIIPCLVSMEPGFSSTASKTEMQESSSTKVGLGGSISNLR